MEIQRLKIKDFFKELTFKEEIHKYFISGKPVKYSVSGIIKKFVEFTDFTNIALAIDKRDGLPFGTTQKAWAATTKESCDLGTRVHLFGEEYPYNRSLVPSDGYERAIVSFWNDIPDHIVPVNMETQMYHKEFLFAGTADILLFDTIKKEYIIGDYKTNKDLFKNHEGKTLLKPFNFLLDSPFGTYQLQLSFYQILIEQIREIKVNSRKIVWLKPDGNYLMYDAQDLTKELKEYLKNNKL